MGASEEVRHTDSDSSSATSSRRRVHINVMMMIAQNSAKLSALLSHSR